MRAILERRITLAPEVLTQTLEGEAILLDLKSEEYYMLDGVGSRMMSALLNRSSIQEAIDVLKEEYEVERDQLEQDVVALVQDLVERGLVTLDSK